LNQLDGFSVNPRIMVCFSGPVDVTTLPTGISITAVDRDEPSIPINQVLFDPAGMCAYAKPDQVLDQQTRYLMVVTADVADSNGKELKADKNYTECVNHADWGYCAALSRAIDTVQRKGKGKSDVISASLFTTLSATSWLEQARTQINSGTIPGAGKLYGPLSTFYLKDVNSITWMPETGVSGVDYNQTLPLGVLAGVDRVSFGVYLSPLYLNTSGPQAGTISTTPTNISIPIPSTLVPVSFHLFLPAASSAPGKIPVIIYGHGLGDSQFGAPTFAASTWAQKGFATLAIEITGHGYGSLSTTQVTTNIGRLYSPHCHRIARLLAPDRRRPIRSDRCDQEYTRAGPESGHIADLLYRPVVRVVLWNPIRSCRAGCSGRHAERRRRHASGRRPS
jgi:hypothetical protein